MASPSKLVAVFAILIIPSRLPSQTHETPPPNSAPRPVQSAVMVSCGIEARSDDSCNPSPWWESICRIGGPACNMPRHSIFAFGGLYTRGSMGDTADIFNVTYDDHHYIGALGYQRYFWSSRHFNLGLEIGVGARFNDDTGHVTGELWGGPVLRYDGIVVADRINVIPSLTAGLSVVNESIGHERTREINRHGEATLLFYLGPEIAISHVARPNFEIFYRLHHRCGCNRNLGHLSEGYNANCVGVRIRF
jgi:hypothetical protein